MLTDEPIRWQDLFWITIGCAIYGFGLATVNIANQLAEGGITGVTLILRSLLHIDPAYTTILINIPLVLIGLHYLGRRALVYTIWGTGMLSLWLWIWQRVPVTINLQHDLFLAGLLAGLAGGLGSGMVYRAGGTTGGTDVIARIIEKTRGISMGRTLLVLDVVVLATSLVYLDVRHMLYTLMASYIFSRIVTFTQEGAYAARGVLIMSPANEAITSSIYAELERGVTYLKAEGSYSGDQQRMIYCVVAPNELHTLRRIIEKHDPHAFVSIIDVHEAIGEGFSYDLPQKSLISRLHQRK